MTESQTSNFASRIGIVALGGIAVGVLTSIGQGLLPFEVSPLANSSGSWCVAAFCLVLVERSPPRAALLGPLALGAMLAGYAVATTALGHPVSTRLLVFWGAASVVAGPALGVGAAWFRGSSLVRAGLGVAVITGVLIGEGIYGLIVISETTPTVYWVGQIAVGMALLPAASVRLRAMPAIGAMFLSTAIVAVAFYVAYSGDLLSLLP